MSNTPPATRSIPTPDPSERPIRPMDAHSPTKTMLNPAMKLSVLRNATLLDTADPGVAPIS